MICIWWWWQWQWQWQRQWQWLCYHHYAALVSWLISSVAHIFTKLARCWFQLTHLHLHFSFVVEKNWDAIFAASVQNICFNQCLSLSLCVFGNVVVVFFSSFWCCCCILSIKFNDIILCYYSIFVRCTFFSLALVCFALSKSIVIAMTFASFILSHLCPFVYFIYILLSFQQTFLCASNAFLDLRFDLNLFSTASKTTKNEIISSLFSQPIRFIYFFVFFSHCLRSSDRVIKKWAKEEKNGKKILKETSSIYRINHIVVESRHKYFDRYWYRSIPIRIEFTISAPCYGYGVEWKRIGQMEISHKWALSHRERIMHACMLYYNQRTFFPLINKIARMIIHSVCCMVCLATMVLDRTTNKEAFTGRCVSIVAFVCSIVMLLFFSVALFRSLFVYLINLETWSCLIVPEYVVVATVRSTLVILSL